MASQSTETNQFAEPASFLFVPDMATGRKNIYRIDRFFFQKNNAVDITTTMSDDKYSHPVILYHIFGSLPYRYFFTLTLLIILRISVLYTD